ncbi:MAG TPA: hypothetical protein VLG49_01130 [Rhabdochlamydiaceae bacterium]|nr:hypothetical protein [Rhabdochlamydiaceae bacterium]
MENAMWLSSIFGPFLAITGLWMLLYNENFMKVLNSIRNNPGSLYITSVINLLIGLAILSWYNDWSWEPSLLVTLLGWAMIVRSVLLLFIPQLIIKTMMIDHGFTRMMGAIPLAWGILLCWLAFFM